MNSSNDERISNISAHLSIQHKDPIEQLLLKDRALASAAEGITIADAIAPDRPLIYVNEGFSRLTGYSREETLGTNCRFLQGPDTDPESVKQIRDAISAERHCEVELLNYRKDGTPFWNHFSITPIRNATGLTTHFVGIQSDVTRRRRVEANLRAANERMQNDLRAAARVQHALLPTSLPKLSQARIGWAFLPCDELAGDTLDVFQLDDTRLAFYVLDVSGHGVQAALLATTLSFWLSRAPKELKQNPVDVLEHLNENFQLSDDSSQFFTCCYGVLDLKTKDLSFSSAGHPSPIVLRSDQTIEIDSPGFPVGIVASPEYRLKVIKLHENDRCYFYSDGAVEQFGISGRQFGTASLMQELDRNRAASLQSSIDLSLGAVLNSTAEGKTDDDISMLGIEITGRV